MKTIVMWFRNDLRVLDNPALFTAVKDSDQIIPLFIIDENLTSGEYSSSNRNKFLLESLLDLDKSLRDLGAKLVIKSGKVGDVFEKINQQVKIDAVYCSEDYSPYSIKRDKELGQILEKDSIEFKSFPGRLLAEDLKSIVTGSNSTYKVFTPFYNNWVNVKRRQVFLIPTHIKSPEISNDDINIHLDQDLISPKVQIGGEANALIRLSEFIDNDLQNYIDGHDNLESDRTSKLSAYLHFGCISPIYIESLLDNSEAAESFKRQLCWRDFYHYILLNNPKSNEEFQKKYLKLPWKYDKNLINAWKNGQTGYPIVDAAMRQLKETGWMHNRGRLIVGSFLTKDMFIDWREGEKYFMQMLVDGDKANNNGNWQWIASVGVDPAPVWRRVLNPDAQQERYDPDAKYIKRYVPELKKVPVELISNPSNMTLDQQKEFGCIIGVDYPKRIVDHAKARKSTLDTFSEINKMS
jgi:deoxyribodipyrimidine photo-lyase